ncbi:MAG: hypothetical protein A2365_02570 [Candidatus Nealsonbacteria bacterium RIFOXYB1_FULL_40_15]|uniref:CYTH domain-containing protein n=2 Tax=Candidatus Nealsoniibacteriota TaxID=1817911 RepID=A0A1G2ERS8_9BACT|nr:MAG: hypothetical protein A2365_02570 [Candidatus Nealsonbacteria bacterium RIFOXYB1_FULL_40_15]OGZ28505.1 MAG: hypothetical protein A2427_02225 [Candidatus Nealsonbacteria bacterium RIFOXYC1_FULL_40_7]OGZ28969.1 MAG: hypothetical protein A2562_03180 [Candidatus Nealsonbacteria bacterium RIFOXYD1_FULL_39_11]
MAKAFECEIRYSVDDIAEFKKKLEKLNAKHVFDYKFQDFYFRPESKEWDYFKKNLRIRHKEGHSTRILFDKIETKSFNGLEFKRSVFPEGKLLIYSGELDSCRNLLLDLGFKEWLVINKEQGELWELGDLKIALEKIEGLGWTFEMEFKGEDPEKAGKEIEKAVEKLGLDKNCLWSDPISVIYAKANNLI